MPWPLPPDLEAALAASLAPALDTPVGAAATGVATAASPDPLAAAAWLTACLTAGTPRLLAPSARVVALAALASVGGASVDATLRALAAGAPRRLRLSPGEAVLVAALLEGGQAREEALAAPVAEVLKWRVAADVPRTGNTAPPPPSPPPALPPPTVHPPRYMLPITRGEVVWVAHQADGTPAATGGTPPDPTTAPLAHLLRRAADGVLPAADWALAKKLAEGRAPAACAAAAAAAAAARGVTRTMPALAGLATLAAATHTGYGDYEGASTPGAVWARELAGAPVSGAWAAAVVAVATAADPPPPPPFIQAVLAHALHAVPADPADPEAGRAVRLAALLARSLRGDQARRAALEPLRPELEAFALSWSRFKEAADLYRDLKADVGGDGE